MLIGELSRATGASPRSIRHYEKLGLVSAERRANGYRDYDSASVATIGTIRTMLDLGFPTALIEQILPCTGDAGPIEGNCSALFERVTRIRDEMDQKARRLAETRDALTAFLEGSRN